MNSTTRFVPGFNDLSGVDDGDSHRNKKRTLSGRPKDESMTQKRQNALTPKKAVTPGKNQNQGINSPSQSVTSILNYNSPKNNQKADPVVKPGIGPSRQNNSKPKEPES